LIRLLIENGTLPNYNSERLQSVNQERPGAIASKLFTAVIY